MTYPRIISKEAVKAFENDTGFIGIGDRMVRAGLWKIEETCRKTVMAPSHPSAVKQGRRRTPVSGTRG